MSDRSLTAIVEYQIRPENVSMQEWLATWNTRSEDALAGEPETLAYAAAINNEDEHNVLVFERYENGASSVELHKQRKAHEELNETMAARQMTRRRVMSTRFVDVPDYGWWSRPGPAQSAGSILVILGMRFATDEMRSAFIELSGTHADYCWREEPDTLVYSGGIATADADRELDIKAGDLIFVMGCTDMAAVTKHRDDPNHLALGPKFAERGITLQSTFHRSYKTTGHGYLWR